MLLWLCPHAPSPGISWQGHLARPVLQVLSCRCFLPCMASGGCTSSTGQSRLLNAAGRECIAAAAQALRLLPDPSRKPPWQCFCWCRQAGQVWTSPDEAKVEHESELTAEIGKGKVISPRAACWHRGGCSASPEHKGTAQSPLCRLCLSP